MPIITSLRSKGSISKRRLINIIQLKYSNELISLICISDQLITLADFSYQVNGFNFKHVLSTSLIENDGAVNFNSFAK